MKTTKDLLQSSLNELHFANLSQHYLLSVLEEIESFTEEPLTIAVISPSAASWKASAMRMENWKMPKKL
jgi:hypothetical protein